MISFKSDSLHWQPGDVLIVRPENSDEQVNELFEICQEHGFDFGPDTLIKITEFDDGKKKVIVFFKFFVLFI